MMKNIEVKFKVPSLTEIEKNLRQLEGCRFIQTIQQTDIYFPAKNGRLKLRIFSTGKAELIGYDRENLEHPRQSNYDIFPTIQSGILQKILKERLGIQVIVKKNRDLWMFRNVRIHLDIVESLGEFIEFEAVISPETHQQQAAENLDILLKNFKPFSMTPIPVSYSDLLLGKEA